ncbi:MAG: contact-dependent growth inhibition system immunity protein [Myxococcota bacterium]
MIHFATRDERLRQFFGAYFNQDWRLDDPDVASVVDRYAQDYQTDKLGHVVQLVIDDLRWLAETNKKIPSADLWNITFDEYGNYYTGEFTGEDAHQWLEWIARRLENRLKKQR